MNYEKFKGKCARDVVEHNGRTDKTRPHSHSNEDIDPTRSHLNYDLIERENGISATAFFNKQIAEIKKAYQEKNGKALRKDAVTLCSWVVTLPKDFTGNEQGFFKNAVEFFKERYPECIPVTATVHKDETSPHLHYSFIPIQDGRLCAKDLETKKSMRTVHQEMQEHLEQALGCVCHILTGTTDSGNKTIHQLKAKDLFEKNLELEDKNIKLEEKNVELEEKNAELEREISESEDLVASFQVQEFRTETVKGFLGKEKVVTRPRTEEEIESDKVVVAAQSILKREQVLDEREHSFDKEVEERALEVAKKLTVKRLQSQIDESKEECNKAVQERGEALKRVRELEKENYNLKSIYKSQSSDIESLKQEIEEQHFKFTGQALTYEEMHKPEKKKSRGMSR